MNAKDKRFTTILDNLSRKLHKQGVEAKKIQACVITVAEEEELQHSDVTGCETPQALQNAAFYLCGMYLGLRGGDEHSDLKVSYLKVTIINRYKFQ